MPIPISASIMTIVWNAGIVEGGVSPDEKHRSFNRDFISNTWELLKQTLSILVKSLDEYFTKSKRPT
jgi:hypothetical protein